MFQKNTICKNISISQGNTTNTRIEYHLQEQMNNTATEVTQGQMNSNTKVLQGNDKYQKVLYLLL